MFYLKINDQIRNYIKMVPETHFGCKYYCKQQLIAFDELELLRKDLKSKNVNLTNDQFKEILQTTKSQYFVSTHNCKYPEDMPKKASSSEDESKKNDLTRDKIHKKIKNPFFDEETFEKNTKIESKRKKQENKFNDKESRPSVASAYSTISSGISMIVSFFLIVIGSYFLGKSFLGLNDFNTYILMLVVTIIVFISETCLIMLKIHKEQMTNPQFQNIQKHSFAYRFNSQYRNRFKNSQTNSFTKRKID